MTTLAIGYRKNPAYSEEQERVPRLFASIDLKQFGVDHRVTSVPIAFRNLDQPVGPVRVVYSTRLAGLTIERGNLESLADAVEGFLRALIRFERLPRYLFNVTDSAWPIYELTGQLVTRYPGGPVFSAGTIADLWVALADHFKHIGRVASRRDLGILYLSPVDLQLYAPRFTLRSAAAADIPVFANEDSSGRRLVAPLNGHSLAVTLEDGREILELAGQVGQYLAHSGRLADPSDLTIRRLAARHWQEAQRHLKSSGQTLLYHVERDRRSVRQQSPVLRAGHDFVFARESRPGSMTVFLAPDLATLQQRVGEELYAQGVVSSPGALHIGTAQLGRRDQPLTILDQLLRGSKNDE